MRFVRNQVRLNCDLNTAYKSLTDQVKIRQWSTLVPIDIQIENKSHMQWLVNIQTLDADIAKTISHHVHTIDFYVMPCSERTEYCTEIHLIANMISDEKILLDQFSKELLEQLRYHFNKAWVIQDKDLTLSSLKRSI